ncbi:hypothetical protein BFW01_g2071 [Lasiodiplodia theobromae]|nr:hypothetical protein BFW01_g2071 [Lasiodiplodia theobromae]
MSTSTIATSLMRLSEENQRQMTPPSKFMLLPREVRDLIYEEFIFSHHETKVSPPSATERPSIVHLHLRKNCRNTSLMFVNRQIRAEYEDQVYRNSTYQIRIICNTFPLDLLPGKSISDHCKRHLRHLEVCLEFWTLPLWGSMLNDAAPPDVRRYLNAIVATCMAQLPALETLSVRFDYPTTFLVREADVKTAKAYAGRLLEFRPPAVAHSRHLKRYKVAVFVRGSQRLGFALHEVSKRR